MNSPVLLPARTDIQGALEHAYLLLLSCTDQPANETPEQWAIQGSLALGPILWLAKTYNRPDLIDWVNERPTQQQAQQTYTELAKGSQVNEDLNNVRRRLQPFLDQDTATAQALALWLPTVVAGLPGPVTEPDDVVIVL